MAMNHMPKKSTDEDLIKQFLERGGRGEKRQNQAHAQRIGH